MRFTRPAAGVLLTSILLGQVGIPIASAADYQPPVINTSILPSGGITEKTIQTIPCSTTTTSADIDRHKHQQQFRPLVNARPVWSTTRGEGQIVAIIDTGINPHPRLRNLQGLADFNNKLGLSDCDQHGSLVAAILAAQPQEDGFAGVAPGYRFSPSAKHLAISES